MVSVGCTTSYTGGAEFNSGWSTAWLWSLRSTGAIYPRPKKKVEVA